MNKLHFLAIFLIGLSIPLILANSIILALGVSRSPGINQTALLIGFMCFLIAVTIKVFKYDRN